MAYAPLTIAQDTYENAVKIFKAQYTNEESKRRWLDGKNNLEDVKAAVAEAIAKYNANPQSKAWKYLHKFSETVLYYGGIMDVLVQQSPQYVALGWGTMKLLFLVSKETWSG